MEAFVTTGLVLKETRYKESDRILTVLTPELGVISASAQSSLRLKSKLFSACGLFCYSEFSPTGQEAQRELRLLLNCFYMVSESKTDLRVVKAVFELRTMSECGFMPQIVCCRDCGVYDGAAFYLDVQEGHLLCADCAAKQGKTCNLDQGALYALRHICLVDDKKIFAFKISVGSLEKLAAVAERYALVHLDKPLKSYNFLKSLLP